MSDPTELVSPFRLAFRVEGNRVCCYLAGHESMEGAHLMGFIQKSVLDVDPEQFNLFKHIMRTGITAAVKEVLGVEIAKFEETPAPEIERAGSA